MSGTLRLRGSTSGYSELQAPAVAADQTFVLPTAGGTLLTTDSPVPQLTLQLGSASEPSLRFQGDLDTGLFSAGTNTLNLVTGGSSKVVLGADAHTIYAGTGASVRAVDIDSTGKVGIGTTSPSNGLHILDSASVQLKLESTSANSRIAFEASGTTNNPTIGASDNDIQFRTGNAETARLDSDGRLNIGTDTNDYTNARLQVDTNDGSFFVTQNSHLLVQNKNDSTTNWWTIAARDDGNLTFGKGVPNSGGVVAERAVNITSAGFVGIGTDSPGSRLDVVNPNADPAIYFRNTAAITSERSVSINFGFSGGVGAGIRATRLANANLNTTDLRFHAGGTADSDEHMRVCSNGTVSIGNTTEENNVSLLVGGSNQVHNLKVYGSDTTSAPFIALGYDGSTGVLTAGHSGSGDCALSFRSASAGTENERMRLLPSGKLLMHRTSEFDTRTGAVLQLYGPSGNTHPMLALMRNDTAVLNGNGLGEISFFSNDGGVPFHSATILAQATETHVPGSDRGTHMLFYVTPTNTETKQEKLRIQQNGILKSVQTYNSTTTGAANMNVDSAGQYRRSTSSGKYKTDVETIEDSYSDALLNCRPVWYRSTCEGDNPDHGWWGFIAEEVAEIDPRLVQWKTSESSYDEEGTVVDTACEPEAEGVAYDRFVPHLLNLIKRQKETIQDLKTRVTALETTN